MPIAGQFIPLNAWRYVWRAKPKSKHMEWHSIEHMERIITARSEPFDGLRTGYAALRSG